MFFSDIKDSFSYVKKLSKGQLPFSLAEIRQESSAIDALIGPARTESERKQDALKLSKGTVLRCIQFLSPDDANRSFTTLQRDRKNWWRKVIPYFNRYILFRQSNKVHFYSVFVLPRPIQTL